MLKELFFTFFKIGAFTFGGGFAMIPIIQREIVENRNWIKDEEFIDAIALAQASPGPVAVNTSIYVGYKIKGIKGAIICTLGTVLPSFFTILIIAMFFYQFRQNDILDKVFMGIRPAVVALIASAVYKLVNKSYFGYDVFIVALITILLIIFTEISPVYLVVMGAVGSVVVNKVRDSKMDNWQWTVDNKKICKNLFSE